jgi:hypothetical protein
MSSASGVAAPPIGDLPEDPQPRDPQPRSVRLDLDPELAEWLEQARGSLPRNGFITEILQVIASRSNGTSGGTLIGRLAVALRSTDTGRQTS